MAEYNHLENVSSHFMSGDQIRMIRKIWSLVEPNRIDHFTEILIRLFQRYPDVHSQFVRLKHDSMDSVRESRIARAIGCRVGISLRAIVSTLESSELVDHALKPIKINHQHRQVDIEEFKKIKVIIREYFIEHLLGAVSIEAIDTFDVMMDKMIGRLQSEDFVVDSPRDPPGDCQLTCTGDPASPTGNCSDVSSTLPRSEFSMLAINQSSSKSRPMTARDSHAESPWKLLRRWFCWDIDKQTKQ